MNFREALEHKITEFSEGVRRINIARIYGETVALVSVKNVSLTHDLLSRLADIKDDAGYVVVAVAEGCSEENLFQLSCLSSVDQIICSNEINAISEKTSPEFTFEA